MEKKIIVVQKKRIGNVKFLANLSAIEKALHEGWPLYHLHEKYKRELGLSYPQFVRYVHKYIPLKQIHNVDNCPPPPTIISED